MQSPSAANLYSADTSLPRYFIAVGYVGTHYVGFQAQPQCNTVQAEVERALSVFTRQKINTTTSSRTDAGVHAQQNYLHFDSDFKFDKNSVYHLNAILPADIVIHQLYLVNDNAHARFDALSRTYQYTITRRKNPFLEGFAYYFPYQIDINKLNHCAQLLKHGKDFSSFSKKHTDVKTYLCNIIHAAWLYPDNDTLIFEVKANRFLRGMVKALVGTQLKIARGHWTIEDLHKLIHYPQIATADFTPPSHGLNLIQVEYPNNLLANPLSIENTISHIFT